MAEILTNPNWPIPIHSSQLEDEEIASHLKRGGSVVLTYLVSTVTSDPFVAEVNPEHEKRRKQVEQECKQKL